MAHDTADRVLVMSLGQVVEIAPVDRFCEHPRRPWPTIGGAPPDRSSLPAECVFAPRCSAVTARCLAERPPLVPDGTAALACWHPVFIVTG